MSYTLQDIFTSIGNSLVDTSNGTATLAAQLEFVNRGLRRLTRKFEVPNSEIIHPMAIYNQVYEYPVPAGYADYVGLYEQFRVPDNLNFRRVDEFDFWRQYVGAENKVSESRNGLNRYLLVSMNGPSLTNTLLNNCDSLTGNGTWAADTTTSDAANIAEDHLQVREGTGSIRFDIDVSQSVNDYADISCTGMSAVDLSNAPLNDNGNLFVWVYLPSATNYTSFTCRFGSSATDYYEVTVTSQFSGGSFVSGWNLLGFDWTTATTTGTPTDTAISYLFFRATFPSSFTDQTGLRVDWFIMRERKFVNLHYFTNFYVYDPTAGALKENFTSVNDTLSYLNIDSAYVDWITFSALEDLFTYYKKNPEKRLYNAEMRKEVEAAFELRFPSRRELPTREIMDQDDLRDALN